MGDEGGGATKKTTVHHIVVVVSIGPLRADPPSSFPDSLSRLARVENDLPSSFPFFVFGGATEEETGRTEKGGRRRRLI